MFLHPSVIHSVHGDGCVMKGGGVMKWGVIDTPMDPEADTLPPVEKATEAAGMHPTGMHSRIKVFEITVLNIHPPPPLHQKQGHVEEQPVN